MSMMSRLCSSFRIAPCSELRTIISILVVIIIFGLARLHALCCPFFYFFVELGAAGSALMLLAFDLLWLFGLTRCLAHHFGWPLEHCPCSQQSLDYKVVMREHGTWSNGKRSTRHLKNKKNWDVFRRKGEEGNQITAMKRERKNKKKKDNFTALLSSLLCVCVFTIERITRRSTCCSLLPVHCTELLFSYFNCKKQQQEQQEQEREGVPVW